MFDSVRGVRDTRLILDGMSLLRAMDSGSAACAFFDPQYRGLNDKMAYGNLEEGKLKRVHVLEHMSEATIKNMIIQFERVLQPSGHLFLWVDKLMLVEGIGLYTGLTNLQPVDMITWDKVRIGMGYRSRRKSEYLVVLQKLPKRAKDVWTDKGIPDVWTESAARGKHPHVKPIGLLTRLISCVTKPNDLVIDPCAGSYAVLDACITTGRQFLGCDLVDPAVYD